MPEIIIPGPEGRLEARYQKGNKDNSYTKGVICAKVSRYNERTHNKNRLTNPMKRVGDKGEGKFINISWDEAINTVANNLISIKKSFINQLEFHF